MLNEGGSIAIGPNIGFSPRVHFNINDISSISISSNIHVLASSEALAITLPLYIGINYGGYSTSESDFSSDYSNIGGYAYIGYSRFLYTYDEEAFTKGFSINVGARMGMGLDLGIITFYDFKKNVNLIGLTAGYIF